MRRTVFGSAGAPDLLREVLDRLGVTAPTFIARKRQWRAGWSGSAGSISQRLVCLIPSRKARRSDPVADRQGEVNLTDAEVEQAPSASAMARSGVASAIPSVVQRAALLACCASWASQRSALPPDRRPENVRRRREAQAPLTPLAPLGAGVNESTNKSRNYPEALVTL